MPDHAIWWACLAAPPALAAWGLLRRDWRAGAALYGVAAEWLLIGLIIGPAGRVTAAASRGHGDSDRIPARRRGEFRLPIFRAHGKPDLPFGLARQNVAEHLDLGFPGTDELDFDYGTTEDLSLLQGDARLLDLFQGVSVGHHFP